MHDSYKHERSQIHDQPQHTSQLGYGRLFQPIQGLFDRHTLPNSPKQQTHEGTPYKLQYHAERQSWHSIDVVVNGLSQKSFWLLERKYNYNRYQMSKNRPLALNKPLKESVIHYLINPTALSSNTWLVPSKVEEKLDPMLYFVPKP